MNDVDCVRFAHLTRVLVIKKVQLCCSDMHLQRLTYWEFVLLGRHRLIKSNQDLGHGQGHAHFQLQGRLMRKKVFGERRNQSIKGKSNFLKICCKY